MSIIKRCTFPHCSCEIHCDTPVCAYCDQTEGLRQYHDGGGYIEQDYICEDCFTGTDTGPSFDDLPLANASPRSALKEQGHE